MLLFTVLQPLRPLLKLLLSRVVGKCVAEPVRSMVLPAHAEVADGVALAAVGVPLMATATCCVPAKAQPLLVPLTV